MPTTFSVLRMVQLLSKRLPLCRPTRRPSGCSLWQQHANHIHILVTRMTPEHSVFQSLHEKHGSLLLYWFYTLTHGYNLGFGVNVYNINFFHVRVKTDFYKVVKPIKEKYSVKSVSHHLFHKYSPFWGDWPTLACFFSLETQGMLNLNWFAEKNQDGDTTK